MAERVLALLRGVNVGGNNILPMAELRAMVADMGCDDVQSYIQSGNVVFRSDTEEAALAAQLRTAIHERFGIDSPVILRRQAELAAAAAALPFAASEAEQCHVVFLAAAPGAVQIASIDPNRSPGDRCAVLERHAYLHLPNGAGRSKLTNAYLDARLGTIGTARNWRTVQHLLNMLSA